MGINNNFQINGLFSVGSLTKFRSDIFNFKTIFLSIIIEALPFIIIGVFVSAILHNFVSEETIRKVLPKNKYLSILLAAFMGVIFPICECGIVPIVRKLINKGVPAYTAITFMLAAPIINPVVASSTVFAFNLNPTMVWYRLGLAFVVSTTVGVILSDFIKEGDFLKAPSKNDDCGCGCGHEHHPLPLTLMGKINNTFRVASDEFFEMGKYMMLGAFIAATVQTFVTRNILLNIGNGIFSSILAMITLAFGVSVCSSADAFIAASFAKTFTIGSLLAFMVFGPMIDIKNTLMLFNAFKTRYVIMLISAVLIVVIATTFLFNLWYYGGNLHV